MRSSHRRFESARRGGYRGLGAGAAVILLLGTGCHRRLTRAECDAMLDRYVDMSLGDDRAFSRLAAKEQPEAREAALAEKRQTPLYRAREQQCLREVSRQELDCAMKAPTANAWEACIE